MMAIFLNETENKADIMEVKEYTLPTRVEFVPEVNDVLGFVHANKFGCSGKKNLF